MTPDPAQLTPDVRAMLDRAGSARSRGGDPVLRAVAARLDQDDQVRAAVAAAFRRLCARLADDIADASDPGMDATGVADAIAHACFDDAAFVDALSGPVRLDRLAAALPFDAGADPAGPSLLVRLARSGQRSIAAAATTLLTAESARRAGTVELPRGVGRALVWRVAAAMRTRARDPSPAIDHALAAGARSVIGSLDDVAPSQAAAMRLVATIDARPDELAALVEETLSDRRLTLLAALLAHALALQFATARDLLIDPAHDPLWLAMRALDLPRPTIARAGYLLNDADPAGDVEHFGDRLDTLMRVPVAAATAAVAPLSLDPDYRAALASIGAVAR